jgi:hypothetical protein
MLEEFTGGFNERGQRTIGVVREEIGGSEGNGVVGSGSFDDEGVESVGTHDMDIGFASEVTACTCGDDGSVDLTTVAGAVVAAEVAGVGGGLVEVGLGGCDFPFELEHYNRIPSKDHDIGSARFHGELIFEDGAVLGGAVVVVEDLAEFRFEFGDGIVPCADLFG